MGAAAHPLHSLGSPTMEDSMSTGSEPPRTPREPILASVGQRRRSLSGVAILALTIATLAAVLVVILANAML
jgi:hypothetical protein